MPVNPRGSVMFLVFMFFPFVSIWSQSSNESLINFSGMKSVGEVPNVMVAKSIDKYTEQAEREISSDEKRSLRKAKDEFYLSSNFQVDALMKSGSVVFGDEISIYLNQLKDNILDANGLSSEKSRIQIFTVKSSNVNAFATDQGIVFFTTGLFSRLKNEAQVSFILGHELSHYLEKHNVDSHVRKSTLKKKGQGIDANALLASLSKYSRNHEFIADKGGYDLFKKMNYPRHNSIDALKTLGVVHVSKHRHVFETSVWENDQYFLPDSIYKDSQNEIVAKMDDDDKESSHPKLTSRIEALQSFIDAEDNANESFTGLNTQSFNALVELATFETLHQNMLEFNYSRAAYDAYCLKKKYPNNPFIDKILTHSMYGLAKFKVHEMLPEFDEDYVLEGEEQSLFNMVNDMAEQQVLALALKISLEMSNTYPSEKSFVSISEDLALELCRTQKNIFKKFVSPPDSTNELFQFNALHEFVDDDNLKTIFDKAVMSVETEEKKEKLKTDDAWEDDMLSHTTVKGAFTNNPYLSIDLTENSVDDLIVFSPIVTQLKSDYSPNLINSDMREEEFLKIIDETAHVAGVNCKIYSYHALKTTDTEMMNNMSRLGDYITEVMEFKDIGKVPFLTLDDEFKNKLGTSNILFMTMTENGSNHLTRMNLLKMILIYPIFDSVLKGVFPQRKISYENYLLDIEEKELIYMDTAKLFCRNNKGQLKSKYYSLFNNLKNH